MWVPEPTDWFIDKVVWERMCRLQRQVMVHARMYYILNQEMRSDPQWSDRQYDNATKELQALIQQHPEVLPHTPFPEIFSNSEFKDSLYDEVHHPWAVKVTRMMMRGVRQRYETLEERQADDARRKRPISQPIPEPEPVVAETADWWTK